DAAALERAAWALSARHPALRATFHEGPGGPAQRIGEEPRVDFLVEDGTGLAGEALKRRLSELAYRPFDLGRGPLWRLALLRLDGGDVGDVGDIGDIGGHALALAVHHIVSDFWSLAVMLRELGALYGAEVGAPAGLPAPTTGYAEVARQE